LHAEPSVQVIVSNVWSNDRILEDTTEHTKRWVNVSEWEATGLLDVHVVGDVLEDGGKESIIVMGVHTNVIFGQFGV